MPDTTDRTSPELWFVNYDSSTCDGNLVTALVDGHDFFAEVDSYLSGSLSPARSAIAAGDFGYFIGWEMDAALALPTPWGTGLLDKLKAALAAGADIRLLLWPGPPPNFLSAGFRAHYSIGVEIGRAGGYVALDYKLPNLGSHHQKCCIFGEYLGETDGKKTFKLAAFCGGIDLTLGRYDTSDHTAWPFTGADPSMAAWHDVHAKVEGPAAKVILEHFVNRWNEQMDGKYVYKTATPDIALDSWSFDDDADEAGHTHVVEVLSTYASPYNFARSNPFYDFAPEGIRTIEEAYKKAISQAEHYVYIETPFFVSSTIIDALYDRLEEKGIEIIVLIPYLPSPTPNFFRNYQQQALDKFSASSYPERFNMYDLRLPGEGYRSDLLRIGYSDSGYAKHIYVHSKIMIVDDIYVTIGSANINNRSMTKDTELNIAVLDKATATDSSGATVCKFARDLRIKLWKEHLALSDDEDLRDISAAIRTWKLNVNHPNHAEPVPASRVNLHVPKNIGPRINFNPKFIVDPVW